jgi:hypothetical protein
MFMNKTKEFSSNEALLQALRSCNPTRCGKDEELEKVLFDDDLEEALDIDQSGLQASSSVINVRKARKLASLFINEAGDLLSQRIKNAKEILLNVRFSLGVGCEESRKRYQRLLAACTFLADNIDVQRLIKKMSRPLTNKLAEQVIRDTLLLPESVVVHDGHARQAAIAAFLTTLRQSLGSCFATAPSILIHEEQPTLFFKDLDELIGTGKLKKTVAGNEYSVPLSTSWGQGDLKKQFFLTIPLASSPQPIWVSPTLIRSLQSIEILKDKKDLFPLLEKVFRNRKKDFGYFISSADEILKLVILDHLNLTETDLEEHLNKPRALRQTSLVVTTSEVRNGKKNQEKLFSKFFTLQAIARRFFKAEADCALLKSWEFTIASFAEVKFEFARWNFYSSLGINWNDAGGIGELLYEIAKQRVDETNRDLEEQKERLEAINIEVDYLARRLSQTTAETELTWLRMEYQTRQAEQYHIRQLCDIAVEKTNKVSRLHQFLIDSYDTLMKEYFQEIYDADIHDVEAGPFDDSPAGFHLIYKYGRTNPSLWTKVTSLDEYVDALVSFFTITEQELLHKPEVQGIEAEFSSIITRLATHVRSDEFLESAFTRTALAHGVRPIAEPLHHLNLIEKKPWVYTSGGSMNTLVSAYFCLEGQPEEISRWVENETELLAFLIDTTRLSMNRANVQPRPERFLMHSPTHAFLLTPFIPPFDESVTGEMYSYSWIAYRCTNPSNAFYTSCVLDPASVHEFCRFLATKLPERIQDRFIEQAFGISGFIRPYELAKEITRLFALDGILRMHENVLNEISLDSLLFESVPYTNYDAVRDIVLEILSSLFPKEAKTTSTIAAIDELLNHMRRPIRSKELLEIIKTACVLATKQSFFSQDILESIVSSMRAKRLLPPAPLVFADSNWVKDFFAFVVSPASQELELWSVNAYGTEGRPITNWKMWVNGSRKDRQWGVLANPKQYRSYYGPQKPFGMSR